MIGRRLRSSGSAGRVTGGAPADIRPWPNRPEIAHLVLLDITRTPTVEQITRLASATFADDPSLRSIRTSALFPGPRDHFAAAGFQVSDRLALLERTIDRIEPIRGVRRHDHSTTRRVTTRRLGQRRFAEAAGIDQLAFPDGWSNSATSLGDIANATPRHRNRGAFVGERLVGFAITGLAGPTGYIQRLAVEPASQGVGVGRVLVDDALGWLQRRGAVTALVNTGVDNEPALRLYRSLGFRHRRDELVVMQLDR